MRTKLMSMLAAVAIVSLLAVDAYAIGRGGGGGGRGGGGHVGGGGGGRIGGGGGAHLGGGGGARPNVSRPNLGGGGAHVSRPNLGGGGGAANISRPNISQPNISANRPTINRPNISQPNLGANRPSIQRPNTSVPSIGGNAGINRPQINRPSVIEGGNVTRPNIGVNRPSTLPARPDLGNIGANRPGGGTSLPNIGSGGLNRPSIDRPHTSLRPSDRPSIDRPTIGGGDRPSTLPARPDITRPSTRPTPGDIGDFLGIQRPGADGGGIQRPDITRPTRPGQDGGGIARPDRPSILPDRPDGGGLRPDRPDGGLRPDRPDGGGIVRPDRPGQGGGGEQWVRPDRPIRPEHPDWNRPDWNNRPNRPGNGNNNNIINNRPGWVNISRDRVTNINNNWNTAITGNRRNNMVNWRRDRPDRVARWGYWGNNVRDHWFRHGFPCFNRPWWNNHNCSWGGWNYWHNWSNYNFAFWWRRPVWNNFNTWWAWQTVPTVWTQPIFYDYGAGGNVVFQDNSVFINGEAVASQADFAQSAADLATVAPPENEEQAAKAEWMPLGTFAVATSEKEAEPTKVIQLAVDRQGVISGTFFNEQTDVTQAVQGQVDKETQRVAFRIGDNENVVVETGLYNLTQDETPVLVHYGADKTEYFLLVRLPEPEDEDKAESAAG